MSEHASAALQFVPLLPIWAIAGLLGLALLAVGVALVRHARGAIIRALAFGVLLLWLLGPRLVRETRQPLPDIGLLVVDQSASMQVGNRTALAEAARASIVAQASRFPGLELRTIAVPPGGNAGTPLFGAIEQALAEIPRSRFAGTIAITDGQVHDAPDHAPGGEPLNVLVPARGEEIDRRLRVVEAPGYGLVGKPVTLRVVVEDLGISHRATASLTIRRDGEPSTVRSVPVGIEQTIEVPITRAGPTIVELAASPLAGEVSTLNNREVVEINGVRDRLRVLLVSGEPHPGERTWRRLLKADPAVDLVHFTILRPPEKDDLTPLTELALIAFPVRELFLDKIAEFDLIILDRFQNRGLLPLPFITNIANRVHDGGALLLSVGPEFSGASSLAATPLGTVLPSGPARFDAVINEKFRPEITSLGQRHPVTEGLPGANTVGDPSRPPTWGDWYRRIQPADVRGEVVLQSPDGQPLLALDRIGKGRTALLLSDQIWLWSRGHENGGPQAELLRRLAHWLMQEPSLEEEALTAHVSDGRLAIDFRSLDALAAETVTVTGPDGQTQTLGLRESAPGRFRGDIPAPAAGVWQVADGKHVAFAAATAINPMELSDLRATADRLSRVTRPSGGRIHWLQNADGLTVPELRRSEAQRSASGSSWIGLERRHDHIVTGVAAMTLFPAWIAAPLMLGLIGMAWRREGK